jgi:hypothetical protein
MHTRVVDEFPQRQRHQNLAIPGYELSDCLRLRPAAPLVHRDDPRQTVANLVLGLPALTSDPRADRPTQFEYAVSLKPTLAIVELGYGEALRATLGGSHRPMPSMDAWSADYGRLVSGLRESGAEVVVATVPDPSDTAGCLRLDDAARVVCAAPQELAAAFGLRREDCLTVKGVMKLAFHLLEGTPTRLDDTCVLRSHAREAMSAFVARMNDAIHETASQSRAHVLPLDELFARLRRDGVNAGSRHLTADLLGGLFTLNGCFPGATGHALIANELLQVLNSARGTSFPLIDIMSVANRDAVADCEPGRGTRSVMVQARVPDPAARTDASSRPRRQAHRESLRLPSSLRMTVPLCTETSYHGDAIRVVNTFDEREFRFGSAAGVLFGGPVLFDSHLSGSLHIQFSPPENGHARFQVTFEPLDGGEGVLSAPMFFRWPVMGCRVLQEPGTVASGTVDLQSGESHDVTFSVRYLNSALQALVAVNPSFPDQPIVFPGQYGSAWARFDQRDDGLLDFTFYGTTFLPLGASLGSRTVRWALPFSGQGQGGMHASIPARGLAMHPHLHLSTRPLADDDAGNEAGLAPEHHNAPVRLPSNALTELTLFTRRSSFGDAFSLNSLELGGPATGRSHLLGRLLVQTGEPFGNAMPVVVSLLGPGGLLGQTPPPPLSSVFPGRLTPGPMGHDEFLRFPTRNYFLDGVTLVDDPFDLSVGAIDLRTGRFINRLLHRGFIGQDLFFSLVRVEPRTPQASFLFRGPAVIDSTHGRPVFRLRAAVRVPYPAGFLFPSPDLTTAIQIGEGSVLDPYLWLRAAQDEEMPKLLSQSRKDVHASTGELFSYRLDYRHERAQPLMFEYTNSSQAGTFRLEALSWIGLSRVTSGQRGEVEVLSFAGFGTWSKDRTGRIHQAAAQIAAGAEEYISIQIDGGLVSNVNTKPTEEVAALP